MAKSNLAFVESDHKLKLTNISKCEHKQMKKKWIVNWYNYSDLLANWSYAIIRLRVCLEDNSCFRFCNLFVVSFNSFSLTRRCSTNLVWRLSDVPRVPSVVFRSSSWRSMLKGKKKKNRHDFRTRELARDCRINAQYTAISRSYCSHWRSLTLTLLLLLFNESSLTKVKRKRNCLFLFCSVRQMFKSKISVRQTWMVWWPCSWNSSAEVFADLLCRQIVHSLSSIKIITLIPVWI